MFSILNKAKSSRAYQVFFVKAVEENRQATVFSYFTALIILLTIYISLPSMFEYYKPPSSDIYFEAKVVKISNQKRGSHPVLTINKGGERVIAKAILTVKQVEEIRSLLPSQATMMINEMYSFWPLKELYVDHLDINGKVYKDYSIVYSNLIKYRTSVESVIIGLIIIVFLMTRIWIKHK